MGRDENEETGSLEVGCETVAAVFKPYVIISWGSKSLGSVLLRNCLTGREESVAKDEGRQTSRNYSREDDGNRAKNEQKSERVTAPNVRGPFRLFVLSSDESSKTREETIR